MRVKEVQTVWVLVSKVNGFAHRTKILFSNKEKAEEVAANLQKGY